MRNLLKALCYVVPFLAFIGGAFLSLWLFVQAQSGVLPHAEFAPDSLISAQTFCELLFGLMTFNCMACAFGVVKILSRHL